MRRSGKSRKARKTRRVSAPIQVRFLKKKGLKAKESPRSIVDPAIEQQLKTFEEGVQNFHQQKYLADPAKTSPIVPACTCALSSSACSAPSLSSPARRKNIISRAWP